MNRLWMGMIVVAWACSAVGSSGQTTQIPASGDRVLTEVELRKFFKDATEQANDFYKAEGFPVQAPSPDFAAFKFKLNTEYQATTGVFEPTEQALVSCEISATGKFVSFCNDKASNAYASSPKYAVPPPAKWTKEHAIELAFKFAKIFIKGWGVSLGHPEARYSFVAGDVDQKTGKPTTAPGQWIVSWMEQTPSGIVYRKGGVSVFLSEQYGPDTVFIHFPAQYQDEHITPIAQSHALIEGRKGLDRILTWPPAKTLGRVQVLDTPPPFAVLMIVQPNYMTQQQNLYDAANSNQLKARLAWVITYKVKAEDGDGLISAYIDAKDGSFLGGYF